MSIFFGNTVVAYQLLRYVFFSRLVRHPWGVSGLILGRDSRHKIHFKIILIQITALFRSIWQQNNTQLEEFIAQSKITEMRVKISSADISLLRRRHTLRRIKKNAVCLVSDILIISRYDITSPSSFSFIIFKTRNCYYT